ncbi:MAG: PQQ-binding-like beta-propeller repeat protein, partial [Candidatus Bathyarchaeota archaeon]|nr:PQQ-binding-like beta-propeller repeat protein [Candidatus Bathyarchaeota archaeon]
MSKQKGLFIIFIFLVLFQAQNIPVVLSNNANATTKEWNMFRHDPTHSACTTGIGSAQSAKLLWTYNTEKIVISSPAVANGYVFVGGLNWVVYCLNASNGEMVWEYKTGHEIFSSPAVHNNSVYIGSNDGNVYAFNTTNGTILWKTNIGGSVQSSPTIVNSRLYIGSGNHDVYCLDTSNGEIIWKYPTRLCVHSSPTVADSVVYVASSNYHVYAIDAISGNELWRTHTGTVDSSPTVYNGNIYIGSEDGFVYSLNASTGTKIWEFKTQNSVSSSPAVAYGCVYVGSEDNNVYCLNASNGKKIWQTKTGYWVHSSPAVADGNLFVGSEDYNIYCLDAFTGKKKWSYTTENFVDSSPAIVNGNLFVGSSDGKIYALALTESTSSSEQAQPSNQLATSTIVFDVAACIIIAAIVFEVVRYVHMSRKSKQNIEKPINGNQRFFWILKHADAVCIISILAFSTIFLVDLEGGSLWLADEKVYSQCAFHMVTEGDYLTPWVFGRLSMWLAKPPLFMWLISLSYQMFGFTNVATRFWNPIFGALSLIVIFYLGKKLYNRTTGFVSAIILGTFTTFNLFARRAMTDVPLTFFIMTSVYFLLLNETNQGNKKYAALGGLFFGLAFLTKQIAALLIPIIMVFYYAATGKGIRFLFTKQFWRYWIVSILLVSPWLMYMILRFGPDFWDTYFIFSGFSRALSVIEEHGGGYLFYFEFLANKETIFLVLLLPFATMLCAFNSIFKRTKQDTLLLIWMFTVLGIFTFSQTKIEWYILPAYPAFAIAISKLIHQLITKTRSILPYFNQ